MGKIVFAFAVFIIIMQGCQKKSIPTIPTRTTEPASPVAQTTDVKPDPEIGKTIFTNRCSRCHGLPDPLKYTSQRWDGILGIMLPRARLTKEEGSNVTAYIKANAKSD